MPRVFLRWRPRSFSLTTARSLTTTPKHSMYAIFAYSGVVLGVNGAAYMAVPWSVWDMGIAE